VPAKLLNREDFARIRVDVECDRALASRGAKSADSVFSEWGYVTIYVTTSSVALRHTSNGMRPASKKQGFGQNLLEAMKLVLSHHRGEIELEQVLPKPRVPKSARKPRTRRAK
jgi:hypothetical protein